MKNAPKKIYLQVGIKETGLNSENSDFNLLSKEDITWSDHRINDSDICYELKKEQWKTRD